MIIGVPKEIKIDEFRVGLLPSSVHELVLHGHEVIVESDAAIGIGFTNEDYQQAGAKIVDTALDVFERAELIIKVKEPQSEECRMLQSGQILFTYLHLAPDPEQASALQESGCTAIAYETVTDIQGRLPLLAPMSEVAGRLAIQAGCSSLEKPRGGSGVLLGGVPGVPPAKVVIVGGGVVGFNAISMAIGLQADVTVLDRSLPCLQRLNAQFGSQLRTVYATTLNVKQYVLQSDLVVGAVLVPGGSAPKIVEQSWLSDMHRGSVLVDVSIDQGGCFETSHPTTHSDPTFEVDGVLHYCVANMPGAVPRTAAFALNHATMPYILNLANQGLEALKKDPCFRNGLNIYAGKITHPAVAQGLGVEYIPAEAALET
jgi:alanine dehydrogenase